MSKISERPSTIFFKFNKEDSLLYSFSIRFSPRMILD